MAAIELMNDVVDSLTPFSEKRACRAAPKVVKSVPSAVVKRLTKVTVSVSLPSTQPDTELTTLVDCVVAMKVVFTDSATALLPPITLRFDGRLAAANAPARTVPEAPRVLPTSNVCVLFNAAHDEEARASHGLKPDTRATSVPTNAVAFCSPPRAAMFSMYKLRSSEVW